MVKTNTGLAQVSAAGYLKQAEEIFAKTEITTEGLSHPETFIRVRALSLWQTRAENVTTQISAMIEGSAGLEDLDLLGQKRLSSATRLLLEYFLRPRWFQTPAVLGHAKHFFEDFQSGGLTQASVPEGLKFTDRKIREYVCYLLLDFAKIDPDLDEMPLVAALDLSRRLDLETDFEKLAAKELKLKLRDLRKLKDQATELLAKSEVNRE